MKVSIVINTYNRAEYLSKLFASFIHLKDIDFEVVVVNGPSTDGTQKLLEKYKNPIKIVNCPVRNLSVSRNMGIAYAAGDVVVFIDDDALPLDVDWLRRYVEAFSHDRDHHFGGMGGVVLDGDGEGKQFIGGGTSDYGFQIFEIDPQNPLAPDGTPWRQGVLGANCAFRRDALIKVGGFDEYFRYYLDETDVCFRLRHAGYSIQYLENNGVRHYSASSDRRANRYDRNWDVVTKSDTFFALKNSNDPLPVRIYKTIVLANKKNFVRYMIDAFYKSGEITRFHWLKLRFQWFRGFLNGFWNGLFTKRRLGDFLISPPPFLSFKTERVKKTLRIALLTQSIPGQPGYGGIGRYTYDLARGLHEHGHEVHIICHDEKTVRYESLGFIIHGISEAMVNITFFTETRPILNRNISYATAIENKLASLYSQGIEFDIVHASNWDVEGVAIIREKIYPVALMLVTPLAQVMQTEKWELTDDLRACVALDRWQIEHADAVCVPSKGVLKSYQSLMNLQLENLPNLSITPLGIVPYNQQRQNTGNSRHRLLFVGRLEWRKGIHTLLSALPEIMLRFPNWECHLVGDDQMQKINGETFKQNFHQQHHGADWLNRVVFHGNVSEDELQQHYQNCELFVAPSLFESFGLIFQEAMQYGKAVVGCQTGGVPEVVGNGVEGLLVAPDDVNELRTALIQLMQDDNLRARMGNAARERILQRDNYLTMAARLEEVYLQLVLQKGSKYKARRQSIWNSMKDTQL